MVYVNPLDPATPAATDPVGQGDDRMRELKAAVIERLASVFVDVNTDPMVLRDVSVGTLTPSSAARDLGTTGVPFRDLWLSRALSLVSTAAIQATIGYDAANRLDISVGSGGGVTFNSVGTTPQFTFSDQLVVNSGANPSFAAIGTAGVQGSFRYDSSNRLDITVSSTGAATYTAVGAGAGHVFANTLSVSSGSMIAGAVALAGTAAFIMRAAAGQDRSLRFETGNSLRWQWVADAALESGSNAGSNMYLYAYTDAASLIDAPISIVRAAGGAMTLSRPVTAASTLAVTGVLSSTATVNQLVQSTTTAELDVGTGTGSGVTLLKIMAAAGLNAELVFSTGANQRWKLHRVATTGDFALNYYNSSGVFQDTPFTILATGAISFGSVLNRQFIIDGSAWGAGVASLRLNGLTSGAGAGAGTLTNAPSAGNPAFWVPISIAGTVRYLPAW